VANNGSGVLGNTVSMIDVATNTVVRSVPVGNNPFGVAVTPDGKLAYVTNYGIFNTAPGHTVSVIDTATNQVKTTIPVGLSPTGVAITPNSQFAYIANNNPGSDSVSVINTTVHGPALRHESALVDAGIAVQWTPIRISRRSRSGELRL
jgi:YVTN family beta-propeller protein